MTSSEKSLRSWMRALPPITTNRSTFAGGSAHLASRRARWSKECLTTTAMHFDGLDEAPVGVCVLFEGDGSSLLE